jgi:hypothetical protein
VLNTGTLQLAASQYAPARKGADARKWVHNWAFFHKKGGSFGKAPPENLFFSKFPHLFTIFSQEILEKAVFSTCFVHCM